jgi:hypothetical protein
MTGSISHDGPGQLSRCETGSAHSHERVADRRLRIRRIAEDEPLDALEPFRLLHADGLHGSLPATLGAFLLGIPRCCCRRARGEPERSDSCQAQSHQPAGSPELPAWLMSSASAPGRDAGAAVAAYL